MKTIYAIGILILATIGNAFAQVTPEQIAAAKVIVSDEMKDPESAKFKSITVGIGEAGTKFEGQVFVCGEVNSKNSYGGYAGYSRFVVREGNAFLWDDSRMRDALGKARFEAAFESWNVYCDTAAPDA